MKKHTSEEVKWWNGKQGELRRQLRRQPVLLDVEREESAETSADKVGELEDNMKRRGWMLSKDGRHEK